ncbi:1-aminocyclopropane-1-carboxylate synthase [Trifolium repens]|nr:1-aminocyclopropane-1-carboxylate synthase [Trifolium repens]
MCLSSLQSPEVLNPLADFHFLMINYMERMGKRSPFLTGKYKRPSLRDWDVKMANQELQKIHDIMGLENGLTAGVSRLDNGLTAGLTSLNRTAESPLVLCFDADTCPLSKAEMYLTHCRSCINIYTRTAETLERRIAEANAGTSGKDDAVPEETNRNKDNPMEGEAENERNKSSNNENVPGTGRLNDEDDVGKRTQAGERLNNDNDEDDDNDAKSIDNVNDIDDNDNVEHDKDEDDDEEDEIAPNIIDDAVPAACNIIDHSVKLTPNEHDKDEDDDEDDETAANIIDDAVTAACNIIDHSVKLTPNVGLTLTQETILKFPEFFDGAEASNKNDSVSQGADSATQETMLKFPEFFDGELNKDAPVKQDSESQDTDPATHETILKYPQYFDGGEPNQCRALVLVPDVLHEKKSTGCDSDIVIE